VARTALITGASSGLGFEFCRLAAADGYNLITVARNLERLEQAAAQIRAESGVAVEVISRDLGIPGAAQSLYDEVKSRGRQLEVLINNAGFAYRGLFAQQNVAELESMLETNVVSLTMLTRLWLADMLDRRSGRILNVASTAAFQPGPMMSVYYATKAYVLWLSEALAVELEGSGVSVTVVCPGPVRTGFQARAGIGEDSPLLKGPLVMNAQRVAEIGYRAMLAGRAVVVPGVLNAIGAFLSVHSPRSLNARVIKRLQE
jgi:uncharacterized protein